MKPFRIISGISSPYRDEANDIESPALQPRLHIHLDASLCKALKLGHHVLGAFRHKGLQLYQRGHGIQVSDFPPVFRVSFGVAVGEQVVDVLIRTATGVIPWGLGRESVFDQKFIIRGVAGTFVKLVPWP